MNRLRKTVEDIFEIPFETLGVPNTLAPIGSDDDGQGALLYGSPEAVKCGPCLIQGDRSRFVGEAPVGYWLVGFWGHGVNSFAFYLSRVTPGWRVHLRLPYGGVYSDIREQAHLIRRFLLAFFEFEVKARNAAREFRAIDSMEVGSYRVVLKDGRVITHEDSMLRAPEFERIFRLPPATST